MIRQLYKALRRRVSRSAATLVRMPGLIRDTVRAARKLGGGCARNRLRAHVANIWAFGRELETAPRRLLRMKVPGYRHPILLRTHTSDILVFDQVIYHEEYAPL